MDYGRLRDYRATVGVFGFILVVYAGQLLVAGSIQSDSGYVVATSLPSEVYIALTPWLHSSHQHVIENVLIFLLLGGWTERRVDSRSFYFFVLSIGYVTNLAPYVLGFGGLGLGASGITNALWANFMLVQFTEYQRALRADQVDFAQLMVRLGLTGLALLFVLKSIAEFIGYIQPTPGTATGAHILGVTLGSVWFFYRRTSNTQP